MDDTPHCDPPPLEGLNPAGLLRQGAAAETFFDKAPAFTPPSPEELAAIFPRFEILRLIGSGSMGAVYQVRQRDLDRVAALKILPPAIGKQPGFSERFTREAKALARLNHPGIVTLYEFGQAGDLYFFLMEYVDGANLRQLMERHRVEPREAMAIVPQICDALQYAHDQGVVHRDIKPENLLLDRRGHLKIADFGIARLVGTEGDPVTGSVAPAPFLTAAGGVLGTPAYMAPEQLDNPDAVDHRADIYAVGVVLYQMLTGELPGTPLHAPSRTVRLDVRLDEVVLRALEHDPERRYPQAGEMKTQVETIAASPTAPAPATNPPAPLPPTPETRLSRLALTGLIWACLFPFIAAWWLQRPVPSPVPHDEFMPKGPVTASTHSPSPPLSIAGALLACLSILAALAPFGTTLLGWMAVSKIRRSNGRLHGLPLAVFDGLFFPQVLGTCILLIVLIHTAGMIMAGRPDPSERGITLLILCGIPALVDANLFTTRLVWRSIKGFAPNNAQRRGARLRLILWTAIPFFLWLASSKSTRLPDKITWGFNHPALPTASPPPPRTTRKDADPLLLAEALLNLERTRSQFEEGEIDQNQMETAEDIVAIREADATGNSVISSQIRLACARRRLTTTLLASKEAKPSTVDVKEAQDSVTSANANLRQALTTAGLPLDQPFFGPVIERRLLVNAEQRPGRQAINLDTGAYLDTPPFVLKMSGTGPEQVRLIDDWKRKAGSAITGLPFQEGNTLLTFCGGRMNVSMKPPYPADTAPWEEAEKQVIPFEKATPAEVHQRIPTTVAGDMFLRCDLPMVFQTREGLTGILQASVDKPGESIKVRYKLVEEPPAAP